METASVTPAVPVKFGTSALIVGEWGAGKTTCACTAPGPIVVLDMDNKVRKMINIRERVNKGEIICLPIEEQLSSMGLARMATEENKHGAEKVTQARPKGYLKFVEYVEQLEKTQCILPDGRKIGTVVMDSYTTVTEHLKRLILACNSKTNMTQPLYGTLLSNYEEINNTLLRLTRFGVNVIFICHESFEKDELSGVVSIRPLLEGQMKFKIGKDFEEVYFMIKTVTKQGATYKMLTVGDGLRQGRTSRTLPLEVEPKLSKIWSN